MAESNETKPLSKAAEKYRQLISQRRRPKNEPEERLSLVLGEEPAEQEGPIPPLLRSVSPETSSQDSAVSADAEDAAEQQAAQPEPPASPERQAPPQPAPQSVSTAQQSPPRFLQSTQRGKVLRFAPRKKPKLSKSQRAQKHLWLA